MSVTSAVTTKHIATAPSDTNTSHGHSGIQAVT
jgi:hypothetical protein